MKSRQYKDMVVTRKRIIIALCLLFILFIGLIARMVYVMGGGKVSGKDLKAQAIAQWTSEVKIAAKRGRILDRYGHELAVSANVYRVDADLNTLRGFISKEHLSLEEVSRNIAQALSESPEDIYKKLNTKYGAAIIKREVEKPEVDKIKQLNYYGIIVSPDTKRYYPNNNFLAHVIGHTNKDGDGLTGVELTYNKELSGTPGIRIAETDRTRSDLPYTISDLTKPVDGKDVVLTVDEMIQHFAEKSADQALKDNKAKAVSIMVMNPKNGEVLAMANKPDYNPNNPWVENMSFEELQKSWRNRAVSDAYEPGSIFKVVTATAALCEGKVNPEVDDFNCTGSMNVLGTTFHCWKYGGHGHQKFVDILKNSCNPGFATLGLRIGAEKLNEYIQKFGFGQKTGIDLPGEAVGIVKKTKDVTDLDLAIISFGQVNSVSPIQYMAAFNTIANGGTWIRPHVMKEISHYDEIKKQQVLDKAFDNYGEKKLFDKNKMSELRDDLEKVISEGGGKKTFIEGYKIAGKTGTAQKVGANGRYESGKYISSFAGMAPAEDPIITVFVQIDEPDPSNYYAGQIATPVGKQLFTDLFNYLTLNPYIDKEEVAKSLLKDVIIPEVRGMKKNDALKVLKDLGLQSQVDEKGEYIVDISPKPGYSLKEGSKIILYTGDSANYNKVVVVPNLNGLTTDRAMEVLNSLGLKGKATSSGIVSKQSIESGKEVNKGTTIIVETEAIGD